MPENFAVDELGLVEYTMGTTRKWQNILDDVRRTWAGRPVAEVKAVLRYQWAHSGGHLGEPQLSDWASALAEGQRVDFSR
jgi:hypothetical protein